MSSWQSNYVIFVSIFQTYIEMAKAKKQIQNKKPEKLDTKEFLKIWAGEYKDNDEYKEFYLIGSFDIFKSTFTFNKYPIREADTGEMLNEPIVVFKNYDFTDIEIEEIPVEKMPNLLLENCRLDFFKISDCALSIIELKNTVVKYSFSLDTIKASLLSFETSELNRISILNSTVNKFLLKEKSKIETISIKKSELGFCNIYKNIQIYETYIYATAIQTFKLWDNVEIKGCLDISSQTTIASFSINDVILPTVFISHFSSDNFSINNSRIYNLEISKSIVKKLKIETSELDYFKQTQLDILFLSIEKKSSINHLHCNFVSRTPSQVFINESSISHLDFTQAIISEFSTLHISNCDILKLSLINFCNFGNIFFNGLRPTASIKIKKIIDDSIEVDEANLSTNKFSKRWKGDLNSIINELKENWDDKTETEYEASIESSSFSIIDSDLGKIQFINCKLTDFHTFYFVNSKLLDVFVAGTKLPEKIEVPNGYDHNDQTRLAFGQFKKIYENRGDIPMSLRYLSLEMKSYQALLKKEKQGNYPITGSYRQNMSERFLLFWNRYSNNFGISWIRGVVSTLIAATFCYSIFCWSLGFRFGNNWDVFNELVSFAPQYLNPLRDVDSGPQVFKDSDLLSNVKMNFWARLWDYFSRVIVAYFVYQTIQAFRKLGKSSG
jgi:hypothetical protein